MAKCRPSPETPRPFRWRGLPGVCYFDRDVLGEGHKRDEERVAALDAWLLRREATRGKAASRDAASRGAQSHADFRDALLEAVAEAEAAFPRVRLAVSDYLDALIGRLGDRPHSREELAQLATDDLWLTTACLAGDHEALVTFNALLKTVAGPILGRRRMGEAERDDFLQQMREDLLVARPAPKLANYSGQGGLKAWLRVVLSRQSLRVTHRASRRAETPFEEVAVERIGLDSPNPELDYLKTHYLAEFKEAFKAAMRALPPKERNVLRYYLVKGLNIEQIGRIYGAHRATVARWIAKTRSRLLHETEARLVERLKIEQRDLDSIMAFIHSRLEITLHGLESGTQPELAGDAEVGPAAADGGAQKRKRQATPANAEQPDASEGAPRSSSDAR